MRAYAIGIALLAATPAAARTPRFTRSEPTVNVTLSARVKPYQTPSSTTLAEPSIGSGELEVLLGAPIGPPDAKLLAKLEATAVDQLTPAARPQVLFDRASEFQRHNRAFRARAADAQLLADREPDARKKQQLLGDVTRFQQKAKDYLLKGVRDFKALVDNDAYLQFADRHTALFRYGYLLQSSKYMKEARGAYDQLLKNFPNSPYVAAAHLAFAEYYFDAGQLADAEARYRMVLKFPKSDAYHYAIYKMGWVHYRLQRFQEALESFFQAAMAAKTPALEPLGRAAKLDFVRAYSEIGKADKAYAAFQRVDRQAAFDMLERLGDIYAEQGKLDRSIYISQEMMKLTPTDSRVCTWQYRIARSTLSLVGANNADKIAAIEGLVKLDRALEAKGGLVGPAAQDCRANAVAMSSELGRAFHSEAQKTRNPESLDHAIRLYQIYLDAFPTDAARPEIQVLAGEALWARATVEPIERLQAELFERAAAAFTAAAQIDRVNAREEHKAAGYGWLNAIDAKYVDFTVPTQLTPGAPPPATSLQQRELDMIAAFDAYGAAVGDLRDPDLGVMRFIQARLLAAANQHERAAALYTALCSTHPGASFVEAAAVRAIDSLVLAQRLDELLAFADRLNADQGFLASKPDLAKTVKYVRSRSMRR